MSLADVLDRNQVLAGLAAAHAARVMPYLTPVRLRLRQCLEAPNRPIATAYFPVRGIVSVVATSPNRRHKAEVGVIGFDGMTGSTIALGLETSPFTAFVQTEGDGLCLPARELIQLLDESESLRSALLRYIQAFVAQMAQTALANAKGNITHRLARSLLMAHDRTAGDELQLTHEFLSVMLGVRRSGVTVALHELASRGLISITRKNIVIISRPGLEAASNGLYSVAERDLIAGSLAAPQFDVAHSRPTESPHQRERTMKLGP